MQQGACTHARHCTVKYCVIPFKHLIFFVNPNYDKPANQNVRLFCDKSRTSALMLCTNIDLENLEYRQLTTNKSGGKMVQVTTVPGSSDWNDKIRFQMSENENTHLQVAVWPLSTPMQGQDASRRTLELTVESPDLERFLSELDKKNIEIASTKSEEWFKKSLSIAQVEGMYIYMCKPPSKDGDKRTVKVKVNCGEQRPTNIYVVESTDANGTISYTKGSHTDLNKGVKAMVIVETTGLWFMNRTFGMSLNATEILVWPQRRTATGIHAFTVSGNAKLSLNNDSPDEEMDY